MNPPSNSYRSCFYPCKSLSGLNHFNDFFLGLALVVVANELTFIVINNAFFRISPIFLQTDFCDRSSFEAKRF